MTRADGVLAAAGAPAGGATMIGVVVDAGPSGRGLGSEAAPVPEGPPGW